MRSLIVLFLLFITLFGAGRYLSPVPLPKTKFIDIDIYPCDNYCLQSHLQNGEVFSFLAKADPQNIDGLQQEYKRYATLFDMPSFLPNIYANIVILSSKALQPYANDIAKTLLSYFLNKEIGYNIKIKQYDKTEEIQLLIEESYQNDLLILPLAITQKDILANIHTEVPIFVPTLHQSIAQQYGDQIFFGGVDYYSQLDRLLELADEKVGIFYLEHSPLSRLLSEYILQKQIITKLFPVDRSISNLKNYLYKNRDLNTSSVVLNTPVVKSSLILSQLTLYDIEPKKKLSTQINYSPKILEMTQPKDRENLVLANSIGQRDPVILAYQELLEDSTLYNWLDFSTLVGVDIFFSQLYGFQRSTKEQMIDHHIDYPIYLEEAGPFSFGRIEALPKREPEVERADRF